MERRFSPSPTAIAAAGALADITLFCRAERQFGSVSNASLITLIEALAAAVAHRTGDVVKARGRLHGL